MLKRLLTKSKFKIGHECVTKLYYIDRKEYGNNNVDNSFLKALAEGGFQVGSLAKLYFPNGHEIETLDKAEALTRTQKLLEERNVVIYEAAFQFEKLFIRADIVKKTGSAIELIEVKAKSFDKNAEDPFFNKTKLKKGIKEVNSDWESYLIDVAFQAHVVKSAYPKLKVSCHLMLADKSAQASVDGLNQKFLLKTGESGRPEVVVSDDLKKSDLGKQILIKVDVNEPVQILWDSTYCDDLSFEKYVEYLATAYVGSQKIAPAIGGNCKSCEFRIGSDLKSQGLKSAFEECWKETAKLRQTDFERPMVFDIWNFRKTADLVAQKTYFIDQVHESDVSPKENDGNGLTSSERQWIQVQKAQAKDKSPFFDHEGLRSEMANWKYPLNFIDFETTMVAIPFNKGRRPYEQIAFQFSHHTVDKDGTIKHQTEYINREKGKFPNFDFVRNLKKALETNQGTIFRYAAHENTVLCQIREQLLNSPEKIADRDELVRWIETITKATGSTDREWEGHRNMVDMCELVKKYYYHPYTNGSNSIKKVLPAILKESKFLQEKYSKAIYGSHEGIASKNYKDWQWLKLNDKGEVIDPYKLLPPIFSDLDLETMDSLVKENSLADGGAAMTAYSRMQFTEMSELEADRVSKALLKYCELDTFAMVMIFEYWQHEIEKVVRKAA